MSADITAIEATLTGHQRLVYDAVIAAADAGHPAPGASHIAQLTGSGDFSTASRVLASLARKGLITVERGPRARVVTIIKTGKRTAGSVDDDQWRPLGVKVSPAVRDKGHNRPGETNAERSARAVARANAKAIQLDDIAHLIVNRTPCFGCNVRADLHDEFGCGTFLERRAA